MHARGVLVVACLMLSPALLAQVYTWKDAQGVTHFSATPPVVNKAEAVAEDTEVTTVKLVPSLVAEARGHEVHCGQQTMSLDRTGLEDYLVSLGRNKGFYERAIADGSANGLIGRYRQSDYYTCFIKWIDREAEAYSSELTHLRKEYEDHQLRMTNATRDKNAECPDFSGTLIGPEAQTWYACDTRHRGASTEARKRLQRLQPISNLFGS
ncbi:DUF4124 domain-containing protein [Allohahella marinimesophila]|uniref:DUF4124 domain-containing protein n=1 Tax=Allohahella marinimesophila TaxID=1054972 RepID=A0ABP7Q2X7_9GAMM